MSWLRDHAASVLKELWSRKFQYGFTWDCPKSVSSGVIKWLTLFDEKGGTKLCAEYCKVIAGGGPGDDDGVEVSDLAVGADVKKMLPFIHSSFSSLWSWVKSGEVLILPGRDAWAWFVMAKRFGVPAWNVTRGEKIIPGVKGVLFDPAVSRGVVYDSMGMMEIFNNWGVDPKDRHLKLKIFDTGFSGTIPMRIKDLLYYPHVEWLLFSHSSGDQQQFPSLHDSRRSGGDWRHRVMNLENWPKYWVSGQVWCGEPLQAENKPLIVVRALAVTILLMTLDASFCRTQKSYGGDKVKSGVWWDNVKD
jgi:hypothetical protein